MTPAYTVFAWKRLNLNDDDIIDAAAVLDPKLFTVWTTSQVLTQVVSVDFVPPGMSDEAKRLVAQTFVDCYLPKEEF